MEHSSDIDLKAGVPVAELAAGGIISGRIDGEEAILVRRGTDYFAVGAACTHYHGPLAKGLIVENTIRCPLHHACFSLMTGEALYAPALDPIACWRVQVVLDRVFVREKLTLPKRTLESTDAEPSKIPTSVVIVGGGASALGAADMLRRSGYLGPVTMVSADDVPPYDRPNLSKDFLAGTAPEEWIPLRSAQYYIDQQVSL